ncbi:MAG: DNA mismatch repair endonuclease MutL [Oceanipulchritudo sp.]
MPDRIVKLPDSVANQIAAGEVVERPVAVVKELVENALDAESRSIEIQFEQGGKSLIRVLDDGIGMSPADARMSLQRHATSKIREVADILRVGSFGFRGEALPSIASVSRFCLRTRPKEAPEGFELRLESGREESSGACGMSPGTEVMVSRLFQSVPARRKFMKTDRTEAAHILQMCRLLAVAHPEVAFSLIEDGHEVFRTPACPDLLQRVREIFGKRRAGELFPFAFEREGIRVRGLLGRPGVGKSTRAEMVTYVNRRPVDSRLLNYALIESYHRYLPRGRYPAAFLFVELPAGEVDVNVHPTKREVKFRAEPVIRNIVMSGLTEVLEAESRPLLRHARPVDPVRPPAAPPEKPVPVTGPPKRREWHPVPESAAQPVEAAAKIPAAGLWRFCGSFREEVGLFESPDGLILLNARAARERILFERIEASLSGEQVPQQPLLIPAMLELAPLEASVLTDQLAFFSGIGFELEPFGRHMFRIRAVPAWIQEGKSEDFIAELVGRIRERGLRPEESQPARTLVARLAAMREARGGRPASEREWDALARKLLACENPLLDARGRPTFVEMRHGEISRKLMLDGGNPGSDFLEGGD